MRVTNQRFAGLEHEARQTRLAMEADVEPNTKTHKRTQSASAADRVVNEDGSSARRVDDGSTSLTSFDIIVEPPAPQKCIKDALVNKGTEAVRMLSSATGGLLPVGIASTAIRTIFSRPLASWTLGEETNEGTSRTNLNQLASPCWRKVSKTKSRQAVVADPGGCSGHLRGCPFMGGPHALLSGWVRLYAAMVSEAEELLAHGGLEHHFQEKTSDSLCRTYYG